MNDDDLLERGLKPYAVVRVERTMKFVARKIMDEYEALGGSTRAALGIDPDLPIGEAHARVVKLWSLGKEGLLGYVSNWGMLESEVQAIHTIRVFVDGKLIHEEDMT
jgi:hypothetical protein